MPLALLLAETGTTFTKGLTKLSSWVQLVDLESVLVQRAQAAFIVHWFGTRMPVQGLSVQVVLANLDAVRTRYEQVLVASRERPEGLNLTRPLAGLAGAVVGQLSTPSNAVVFVAAVRRKMPMWLAVIGFALNAMTGGLLFTLGIGIGGPIYLGLNLTESFANDIYAFLGALAEMVDPMRRFWSQISGPRDRVRNPILLQMLLIGDSLASLVPFLFALFGLVITRVGPLLGPLRDQLLALPAFIAAISDVLGYIFDDLMTNLALLYTGDNSPLQVMQKSFSSLAGVMPIVRRGLAAFNRVTQVLGKRGENLQAAFVAWWDPKDPNGARRQIDRYTTKHPLFKMLEGFSEVLKITTGALRLARPKAKSTTPPTNLDLALAALPDFPTFTAPNEAALHFLAEPPGRDLDLDAIRRRAHELRRSGPDPFGLGPAAAEALARARHPESIFAPQRQAIDLQQLAQAHQEELAYRELLTGVIERLLPPKAAEKLASLQTLFQALDTYLHSDAAPGSSQFPVRELPESDYLRPVVHHLRIRYADDSMRDAATAWGASLKQSLIDQTYLAPAGA